MAAQASRAQRLQVADDVIDNNGRPRAAARAGAAPACDRT
ncbi:MAG: hypothetical protein MZW92_01150 [Comamonadaceae bacterium]|nr:hypothetical protein [Comamonadaceae bacterium]